MILLNTEETAAFNVFMFADALVKRIELNGIFAEAQKSATSDALEGLDTKTTRGRSLFDLLSARHAQALRRLEPIPGGLRYAKWIRDRAMRKTGLWRIQ